MDIIDTYKAFLEKDIIVIPITSTNFVNGKKDFRYVNDWSNFNLDKSRQYLNKFKANIKGLALLCGQINNFIVIDIDNINKFKEILNGESIIEYISKLNTPVAKTRKGLHLYFNYSDKFNKKVININDFQIDILTNKSLINIPPTSYKDEDGNIFNYIWAVSPLECPLNDIPDHLINLLNNNKPINIPKRITNFTKNIDINDDEIIALIHRLHPKRSDNYEDWRNIGFCLHNIGSESGYPDRFFELFNDFSKLCPSKYSFNDINTFWDSIKDSSDKPITLGSLKFLADMDSPIKPNFEFNDYIKKLINLSDITNIKSNKKGYTFNANGTCICGNISNEYSLYSAINNTNQFHNIMLSCKSCNGKQICTRSDIDNFGSLLTKIGTIDITTDHALIKDNEININSPESTTINMNSLEYTKNNETKYLEWDINNINNLNVEYLFPSKYNISNQNWNLNVNSYGNLKYWNERNPNPEININSFNNNPKGRIKLINNPDFKEKALKNCDVKDVIKMTGKIILDHISNDFGVSESIIQILNNNSTFINNGTVIISDKNEVQFSETKLINYLYQNSDNYLENFIIKSDKSKTLIYYFDPDLKIWKTEKKEVISELLIEQFKNHFNGEMTPKIQNFIENTKSYDRIYMKFISNKKRNDSDLNRSKLLNNLGHLFPFSNGKVFDLDNMILRNIIKEDYISVTCGYPIRERNQIPQQEFDMINKFYEQIFPIFEEREYAKILIASCLPKKSKKLLVICTDQRSGYNGKSTLLQNIRKIFGNLGKRGTSQLLMDSSEALNGHGAVILDYENIRFTYIEELDRTRPISSGKIKELTGGGNNTISARVFGSDENKEIAWTVTPFITCNDGQFPKIDATDGALLDRITVLPFRSRFIKEISSEPYTYLADEKFINEIYNIPDTHFYILIDSYQKYLESGLPKDPKYVTDIKSNLILSSDPLFGAINDYFEEYIEITDNKDNFIQRLELINDFRIRNLEYSNKNKFKARQMEALFNKWATKNNIIIKDKWITLPNFEKQKKLTNCYITIQFKPSL